MLGNEIVAGIFFVQQAGLALAGAAALWGIFFFLNARNSREEGKKKACIMIASRLLFPWNLGVSISLAAWIIKIATSFAYPELYSSAGGVLQFSAVTGMAVFPIWAILVALAITGFVLADMNEEKFISRVNIFYTVAFIVVFIAISFPTGIGRLDIDRLFFIKNGFPLIFTLGTVIVLDFIFFFTRGSLRAKRQIYPFLPTLNKLVWVGLGIFIVVDGGLFSQPFLSSHFFFIQTLVGILIVNGMLFTGPLMEKLIIGVSDRQVKPLEEIWVTISNISSVITFSCWTSITYITFFHSFNIGFWTLFIIFAAKTAAVYGIYLIIEHLTDIPLSVVNTN